MKLSSEQNIYLIGLMGSGKTTVGRRLSEVADRPFIDLDEELESRTGVSIARIFDIEGEPGFRKRESQLLLDIAENTRQIVSTGGGIVTLEANRICLRDSGIVVYLKAPFAVLWSRLQHCKTRPLLQTEKPKEKLQDLLDQRAPLYESIADISINVNHGSVNACLNKVIASLQEYEKSRH